MKSRIVKDLKDLISKDSLIKSNLQYLGIVGSVNTGEFVKSWSDVDLLFLIKSDAFGNIHPEVLESLKALHVDLKKKYGELEISFLTHTEHELRNYVAFEYISNYSFAQTIYPTKDKNLLKNLVKQILKSRDLDSETIKRYSIYHLRHLRFNLLRKYVSWDRSYKELGKLIVDNLIEASIFISTYNYQFYASKQEYVKNATQIINDPEVTKILNKCYKVRGLWDEVEVSELKGLVPDLLKTLSKIMEIMQSKYNKETPEELLNLKKQSTL